MRTFFDRFGIWTLWMVFFLVGSAIAWTILIVGEFQGAVDKAVSITCTWLNWLIDVSEFIPGLGWATDNLEAWLKEIPSEISVTVSDMNDDALLRVWAVWALTFVAIWLVVVVSSILIGWIMLPFGGSTGRSSGSGGGGGTTTTRTIDGPLHELINRLGVPIAIGGLLLVVIYLLPGASNVIWEQFDKFQQGQSFEERLQAEASSCVPGDQNVLLLGDVDHCVGIYNGSSASDGTKESLKIVLSATCYAYDAYASTPQSTPAWEKREQQDRDPEVYGEKAQWMADQGIPCSVKSSDQGASSGVNGLLVFFLIMAPVLAIASLQRNPPRDGAGNPLPFSHARYRSQLVFRSIALIILVVIAYSVITAIF